MRKTTFLIGTILVALNVQPLYAGPMSKNQKICQEKWGTKYEIAKKFYDIEIDWFLNPKPKRIATEERRERAARRRDLLIMVDKLNEAHHYCNLHGHKYASDAYQDLIKEYNEFFGLSEDD